MTICKPTWWEAVFINSPRNRCCWWEKVSYCVAVSTSVTVPASDCFSDWCWFQASLDTTDISLWGRLEQLYDLVIVRYQCRGKMFVKRQEKKMFLLHPKCPTASEILNCVLHYNSFRQERISGKFMDAFHLRFLIYHSVPNLQVLSRVCL